MPVYIWVGKNRNNDVQKGEIDLPNEDAVRNHLNKLRITPTKIKKKPKDLFENVAFLQPPVKEKDVIIFCRQFSTMIDAGLPIIQCLEILQAQQENKTFKIMLKRSRSRWKGGRHWPKPFGNTPSSSTICSST
jgi:type IV pilus assembly protein PilC